MKKFGKFRKYEPLEVEPTSIRKQDFSPKRGLEEILKLTPDAKNELEAELNTPVIEIAPAANVYQIPPDQKDLADFVKKTLSWYNYYVVELGLNVMVGRKIKIPELLFKVVLQCDKNQEDVIAYDIAPKDETTYTELLKGKVKINLGVTTLLKFIPVPLGGQFLDLLSIEINPWEFEWGISNYLIDACGEKDCNIYWKIYETDMVQGFNPSLIVRAKKEVKTISAGVRCVYKLKTSWFAIEPEIESKEKEILIWPAT